MVRIKIEENYTNSFPRNSKSLIEVSNFLGLRGTQANLTWKITIKSQNIYYISYGWGQIKLFDFSITCMMHAVANEKSQQENHH